MKILSGQQWSFIYNFSVRLKISLSEITTGFRKFLMCNGHLLELLLLARKTLVKPSDWNRLC